jgi:leucyl/phenylalanyl-tRNA--protein transferase
MIFELSRCTDFPDPRYGNRNGFYAVGGEISPERLAQAYPMGIFPYYAFRQNPVIWWAPQQRFVIPSNEIHISHSMRNMMNRKQYRCTINQAFADVIAGCACTDDRIEDADAWLGPELMDTWMELHDSGHAKSIEVWEGDELVGGLYGFTCGRAFIGDSMFSLIPSASKLALIYLARHMESNSGGIIDCQLETAHLKSMGARYISYEEYLKYTLSANRLNW